MREINKHAAAERDLIEIWRYTYRQWGAAQADAYIDKFDAALQRLARYPKSGADTGHLLAGSRRLNVGSHHVYYLLAPDRIDVVRVLDARQNAARHLAE